jgi:hypothetical protein
MRYILFLLCFLSISFAADKKKPIKKDKPSVEVSGEVFVVTKGGSNIKLGLVSVYFLTPEQAREALDTNSCYYRAAIARLNHSDSVKHQLDYLRYAATANTLKNTYEDLERTTGRTGKYQQQIDDAEAQRLNLIKLSKSYVPFRTDPRGYSRSMELFIKSSSENFIYDVTNSDAKFKVKVRNQKYVVFASGSRTVSDTEERYYWLIPYKPDDHSLMLSNNNMDP